MRVSEAIERANELLATGGGGADELREVLAVVMPALSSARGMRDVILGAMVTRASMELAGIETPCVCDGCGHAHLRLVEPKAAAHG